MPKFTHAQRLILQDIKQEMLQPQRSLLAKINAIILGFRRASTIISLRRATAHEYADFLAAHLKAGGKVSHSYDYEFERSEILIARRSVQLPNFHGAHSLDVIVPRGMRVHLATEDGHSKLLYPGMKQSVAIYETHTDPLAGKRPFGELLKACGVMPPRPEEIRHHVKSGQSSEPDQ